MLIAIAAYLATNFAAYALILRYSARLRTEKGILLYHLGSAVFVGIAGLGFAVIEPASFGAPGLVLVLSAHGIYSLSFLELWSLAEGGYSLYIIGSIAQAEAAGSEPDFLHQEQIGEQKERDRLTHLKKMGLVAIEDGVIRLTVRGRTVATMFLFFVRWSNARRSMSNR